MPDKQSLLTTVLAEYERWQTALNSLDEAQLTSRTLPADLSIKDVIAHLHAWQQISIARLEAAIAEREPVLPAWREGRDPESEEDLEAINAAIRAVYFDQPWPLVYGAWRTGFLHLLNLAAAIPPGDLFDTHRYAWLNGYSLADVLQGSYEHHHDEHGEHYATLIAWRDSQARRTETGGDGS